RVAIREQQFIGFAFRNDAAAYGKNQRGMFAEYAFEHSPLDLAILALTVKRKDIGERHARFHFDFCVEFDERSACVAAKTRAQGGLSCTAQSDESNALAPL